MKNYFNQKGIKILFNWFKSLFHTCDFKLDDIHHGRNEDGSGVVVYNYKCYCGKTYTKVNEYKTITIEK